MKLRDGLVIHIPLFRKYCFSRSTFSLSVKFYLTVGVSYVIFELAHLEKTTTMLGMSLYQLMIKLLQPIDGIKQIKP